jgi:hypothetical protein
MAPLLFVYEKQIQMVLAGLTLEGDSGEEVAL